VNTVSSKSPAVNNNNNNKKAGSAAPTPKATPLKAATQAATPKSVAPASKAVVPVKEVEKAEADEIDEDVSGSDSLDLDAFGDDEPIFYGVKLTPGAEFVALPPADLHLTGVRWSFNLMTWRKKTFFFFDFFPLLSFSLSFTLSTYPLSSPSNRSLLLPKRPLASE
jgi:hypothetical protein